jgi:RNA polymerase sigma factor (sigma-70 family)
LVDRFHGRLLNFAQSRLGQRADAEDAVQETFVGFLSSLKNYRGEVGLETYLFIILRRKIINSYRGAHGRYVCLLQDVYNCQREEDAEADADRDAFGAVAGSEMTGSFYMRRDEQGGLLREVLAEALADLVEGYKSSLRFRDVEIVELLFYCQLPNQDVARLVGAGEKNIAVIKHRCLKRVHAYVAASNVTERCDEASLETLLTDVWETQRLSCPKRNTIGAYLLGTLEKDWQDYVDFHVNRMGCHFCRASLEDLKQQSARGESQRLQERIMESTVGFLKKPM